MDARPPLEDKWDDEDAEAAVRDVLARHRLPWLDGVDVAVTAADAAPSSVNFGLAYVATSEALERLRARNEIRVERHAHHMRIALATRADQPSVDAWPEEAVERAVVEILASGPTWRPRGPIVQELASGTTAEAHAVEGALQRLVARGEVTVKGRGREQRIALASRASESEGWRTFSDQVPTTSAPVPDGVITPDFVNKLLETVVRDGGTQANVYWMPSADAAAEAAGGGRCRAAVLDDVGRVIQRRYWTKGSWRLSRW